MLAQDSTFTADPNDPELLRLQRNAEQASAAHADLIRRRETHGKIAAAAANASTANAKLEAYRQKQLSNANVIKRREDKGLARRKKRGAAGSGDTAFGLGLTRGPLGFGGESEGLTDTGALG